MSIHMYSLFGYFQRQLEIGHQSMMPYTAAMFMHTMDIYCKVEDPCMTKTLWLITYVITMSIQIKCLCC